MDGGWEGEVGEEKEEVREIESRWYFGEREGKSREQPRSWTTPGYTRPRGESGSSACIPRRHSVSPTNRQLQPSSGSALRYRPHLRLQPRLLRVKEMRRREAKEEEEEEGEEERR